MLSNLLTIPHVVHSNSQNYPNDIAMREKKFGVWKTKTWLETYNEIKAISLALKRKGVLPSNFSDFLNMCNKKYNLEITGAMCMPPADEKPRKYFENMRYICNKENIKDISMGMSNDYKDSLKCGSNLIRVGSRIFS